MMQTSPTSPNDGDMGSLDRLDSLDEYFMINSPPESPRTPRRTHTAAPPHIDLYGYYAGAGNNAVEMSNSQQNVKQSTSNITVDRSNAIDRSHRNSIGGFSRLMPATQKDIDEILKLDDKDFNLAEMFLGSKDRTSLNASYKAKGALKGHDKELHRTRSHSLSSSFLEDPDTSNNANAQRNVGQASSTKTKSTSRDNLKSFDSADSTLDFDLGVEPTPLSEIRAKQEQRQRMQSSKAQEQQKQQPSANGLTSQKLDQHEYALHRQHRLQHSSNYYPFGRSYQLPIPTMLPESPQQKKDVPLAADALATAAAIASVQSTDDSTGSGVAAPHSSKSPGPQHGSATHPHSPPIKTASPSSWQQQPHQNGSRPESRTSNHSAGSHQGHHHQPHSPTTLPPQHPPPTYPGHPPAHGYQPHTHHPPQHHSMPHPGAYAPVPHHLTTPLAYGGTHKIVGPYTTAQQGSTATRRRTTVSATNANSAASTSTSNSIAAKKTATNPAPAPASAYLPRRGAHTSREASTAHTTPKGVLEAAAKQRSGYSGFHKPATSQTTNTYHHPLPSKYPHQSASAAVGPPTTIYTKNASAAYSGASKPAASQPSVPTSGITYTTNGPHAAPAAAAAAAAHPPADTAYERKKQRAKDARVKLNESIERLHISMGTAGSESRARSDQLREIMQKAGRSHESTTDHQAFELMESCVKTAESAKKWDRPNFVGSAATMIQCLNSQCEILMKELKECQEALINPVTNRSGRTSPSVAEGVTSTEMNSKDSQHADPLDNKSKPQEHVLLNGKRQLAKDNEASVNPEKRTRINGAYSGDDEKKESNSAIDGKGANPVSPTKNTGYALDVPGSGSPLRFEDSTMDLIASFLDPVSLVNCIGVCKKWSKDTFAFAKDETWTCLCLKRWGSNVVRQWKDRNADEDEGQDDKILDNAQGGDERVTTTGGLVLYRTMALANVMPTVRQKIGTHIFGTGRLACNAVAAWAYVVQRSNGETMRSVKRNPNTQGNSGVYTSLPVVELRIVIQNIGGRKPRNRRKDEAIVIKNQRLTVDASTRRRGETFEELDWDERFLKRTENLDGSTRAGSNQTSDDLVNLKLFDAVVLVAYFHARRCSTTTKFLQRSRFLKILVSANGTTQSLVIHNILQSSS